MGDEHTLILDDVISVEEPTLLIPNKTTPHTPQFLSTAEAARMLGLSTTLVQCHFSPYRGQSVFGI